MDNTNSSTPPQPESAAAPQNDTTTLDGILENAINEQAELPDDRPQSTAQADVPVTLDTETDSEVDTDVDLPEEDLPESQATDSVDDPNTEGLEVDADTPEEPAEVRLDAPSTWPTEQREQFVKLPKEQQEFLLHRDKETNATFTKKTQELAGQRKAVENVISVLQPYQEQIASSGIGPGEYIGRLLQHDVALRTNPSAAIQALAQAYQVPMGSLGNGVDNGGYYADPAMPQQGTQQDPQISTLQQQLAETRADLNQVKLSSKQQQEAAVIDQVQQFANTKDATGNLRYPHFEDLRERMGRLITAGETSDLEKAYSMALRLDDNLYREVIAHERKAVAKEEDAKRKAALKKAKKAGPSRPATPPGGSVNVTDLDTLLKQTIQNHAGVPR